MESVGTVAAISQLIIYSGSAVQVIAKLYEAVREGPAAVREYESNISHLLNIIERIQAEEPAAQQQYRQPEHIAALILELTEIAQSALSYISRTQKQGFLGIRWGSIGVSPALSKTFKTLRVKTGILHLALSQEMLANSNRTQSEIIHTIQEKTMAARNFVNGSGRSGTCRVSNNCDSSFKRTH